MKPKSALFYFFILFLLFSCHGKKAEVSAPDQESFIILTEEQFSTGDMQLGKSQKMVFDQLVNSHGNIISKPGGLAKISGPVSGVISSIRFTPGQKIAKGQAIIEIGGNELIELQRDFAETSSQLIRVKSEYERLKSLYAENVGTQKEFITAQSEYNTVLARYSALMMKMNMLGLDPVSVEAGNFSSFFTLNSPITGYISKINVALGQYISQESTLAEVFDPSRLFLQVAVFEKDIFRLKEEQKVRFRILGDSSEYFATLKSLGKNVDNETKTILCYAEIDDLNRNNFINNTYVEVRIITASDTVNAVPEEAILKTGESSYVLALEKKDDKAYYFKKELVTAGRALNGYVEISGRTDRELLLKGAYNLVLE